jgi:serine/threonine-protein kinase
MSNILIRKKHDWGFSGHSAINHDYNLKTIGGDMVVVDSATGLMWHQSGSDDAMHWDDAKEWVEDLNSEGYAGYQDWRLPTVDEAVSLLESSKKNGNLYTAPVFSKKQQWILTGDKVDGSEAACYVYFNDGYVHWDSFIYSNFVRPVRSVE